MLQIGTLSRLDLGINKENNARNIYIDMNAWYTDYPNATFTILHKRNGDQTKYAAQGVSFDRETGILTWTPNATDTFYVGKGLAEIRCVENEVIKKTKDIITEVEKSLMLGSGEYLESGWQNFLNGVTSAKNAAEQAAEAAEGAVVHGPVIDEETRNWMVWDADNEEYEDTGVRAEGTETVFKKAFSSVAQMEAYTGTDIEPGDYVIISSGINNADNGKVYRVTTTEEENEFEASSGRWATPETMETLTYFPLVEEYSNKQWTTKKWKINSSYPDYLNYYADEEGTDQREAGVWYDDQEELAVEGTVTIYVYNTQTRGSLPGGYVSYVGVHESRSYEFVVNLSGPTGQDGQDGADGEDGYTPQKGVDYWTAEDIAEMTEDTAELLIDDEAGDGDTDVTWSADKLAEELDGKVDKIQGKGLSENDFTDEEKAKLDDMIDDAAGDGDTDVTWSADKLVDELDKKLNATEKGAAGGLAELDSAGKVPSAQLPSYVDDVQEYEDTAHFPLTGESGKIYVAIDTNRSYRWTGTAYTQIKGDLTLGETSSTAYRGDRGKAAYDHASAKGSAFVSGLYKVTTNAEGHVTAAVPVTKEDITALGIPGSQPDISGKADKDTDAVQGNFAAFDAGGNPVDSGHKHSDYLTEHQDISGKVDKVEGYGLSQNDFTDEEKAKLDDMIDDTAGEGKTERTWSADKLVEEFDDAEEAGKLYKDLTTASPIKTFDDGALYPMSLQFAIEPVQSGSGDPSPSNVRPISGFDGAKIGVYKNNGIVRVYEGYNLQYNGIIAVSPTYDVGIARIEKNKQYTITNADSAYVYGFFDRFPVVGSVTYDESRYVESPKAANTHTFTAPIDGFIGIRDGHGNNSLVIVEGTTGTINEEIGSVYPITFPSAAGTVYGGTVTVNPDGTGELVVDTQFMTITGAYIANAGAYPDVTGLYFARTGNVPNCIGLVSCDCFRISNDSPTEITQCVYTNNTRIYFYSSDLYTTPEEAVAYFNDHPASVVIKLSQQTVYSLSAPQVIALLNLNNVWADTGDIQFLSYVRNTVPEMIREDTKGQIGTLLRSIIAPVLNGMVADTALAVNDFRIVGGTLYKVTAPIASGGTLTVGTNVAKTSIGEQITALLNA